MNSKFFLCALVLLLCQVSLFASQAMGIKPGSIKLGPKVSENYEALCTQWIEGVPNYKSRYTVPLGTDDITVTAGTRSYTLAEAVSSKVLRVSGANGFSELRFENLTNNPISVEVTKPTILFEDQSHKTNAFLKNEAYQIVTLMEKGGSQEEIWRINQLVHGADYVNRAKLAHIKEEQQILGLMRGLNKNLEVEKSTPLNVERHLDNLTPISEEEMTKASQSEMVALLSSFAQTYSYHLVFRERGEGIEILGNEIRYSKDLLNYTDIIVNGSELRQQYNKVNAFVELSKQYRDKVSAYKNLFDNDDTIKDPSFIPDAKKLEEEVGALTTKMKLLLKEYIDYKPNYSRGYDLLNRCVGGNLDAEEYYESIKTPIAYDLFYNRTGGSVSIRRGSSNLTLVNKEMKTGNLVVQQGNLDDLKSVIQLCETINNESTGKSKYFNIVQVGNSYRLYLGKSSVTECKNLSEVAKLIKESQDKGNIVYVNSFNLSGPRKVDALFENLKKEMKEPGDPPVIFRNDPPVDRLQQFYRTSFKREDIQVTEEDWGVRIQAGIGKENLEFRIYTKVKEIISAIVASIKLFLNNNDVSTMTLAEINAVIQRDLKSKFSKQQLQGFENELDRVGLTLKRPSQGSVLTTKRIDPDA